MIAYVRTDVESSTYHLKPNCQLLNLSTSWEKLDDIKGLGELAHLGYTSPCGLCGQKVKKRPHKRKKKK